MNISRCHSALCLLIRIHKINLSNSFGTYVRNHWSFSSNFNVVSPATAYSVPHKYLDVYFCTNNGRCWKCGAAVSAIFCEHCKALQRVNKEKNYFELLQTDYSYDLKLSDLTHKYRQLQSVLHPDKFGNKSQDEKDISEEYSSAVNKAYSTLNHPVERGLYMLRLKGSDVEEGTVQLDPTFLMKIMEINEEIESQTDVSRILEYNRINKEQIDVLIQKLSGAFQEDDLLLAKEILTKLKYYTNIDSKLKEIKLNLGLSD